MYGMFETHLTQHTTAPDARDREYVVYRTRRDREASSIVTRVRRAVLIALNRSAPVVTEQRSSERIEPTPSVR
jgi:hypothetical protein